MKYEEAIQDKEAIQRKLDEYRKMLEFAKENKTAQPMIPLLELAIETHEDLLKPRIRHAAPQRKELKKISIRATNLDYKVKDRHCKGVYYPEGDHLIFEMEETKRWFNTIRFPPRVGYLLIPEETHSKYVITKIDYLQKRPKKAVFTAISADAS